MKVSSIWRCAGSAGVCLSVEGGKDMNARLCRNHVSWAANVSAKGGRGIPGAGSEAGTGVGKQDERHLNKSQFETVLSGSECVRRPEEDAALWNLQLETLRKAVDTLGTQDQDLIEL